MKKLLKEYLRYEDPGQPTYSHIAGYDMLDDIVKQPGKKSLRKLSDGFGWSLDIDCYKR